MFFTLLDQYAKDKKSCRGYDLLGIGEQQWANYRRKGELPTKHCKTLCFLFDNEFTEDTEKLCHMVYKNYWKGE